MDKNLKRITGSDRLSKYIDSDYLGSGQLELNTDYVLTIDKLWQGKISTGGKAEQQVVISFKEKTVNGVEVKPMILNATNRRTLKTLYGGDSADVLEGKRVIIFVETGVRDPRTGGTTEGLRIRARRPADNSGKKYFCADCGNEITAESGFSADQIAATAQQRYGVTLCLGCAVRRKENAQNRQLSDQNDNSAANQTDVTLENEVKSDNETEGETDE